MAQSNWLGRLRPGLDKTASVHAPDKPYCPDRADRAFSFPEVLINTRIYEVAVKCFFFLFVCLVDRMKRRLLPGSDAEARDDFALHLFGLFTSLGPTFIKAGQFLATRRDLLPEKIADALSGLQDNLPSMSFEKVLEIIEESLGRKPAAVFDSIEVKPIACASIAQVHKCRMISGNQVCVKVQRPDLEKQFYADLGLMRLIAKLRCRWATGDQKQGWLELVDEFGRVMFSELDFIAEGKNADALRYSLYFETQIKVPKVIWSATGRRVLTLEYLPGIKIDNLPEMQAVGLDKTRLAQRLVDAYLKQILINGFFHADPHPGNIAVDGRGTLLLYDFGIMGELLDIEVQALLNGAWSILQRDAKGLAAALDRLKILEPEKCKDDEKSPFSVLFDYLDGRDVSLPDLDRLESMADEMIASGSVKLPYRLIRVAKTIVLIGGLVANLEPGFSFCKAAGPVIRRLYWEKALGSFVKHYPEKALV